MPHAARQPWSWLIFDVGQKMKRFVPLAIFVMLLSAACTADDAATRLAGISADPLPPSIARLRMVRWHNSPGSDFTTVFAFEGAAKDLDEIRLSRPFYDVQREPQLVAARSALKQAESSGFVPMQISKAFISVPRNESFVYYFLIGADSRSARFLQIGY